jgi:DNA polymerase I-like protein with 3'-5' exonuclease and polymerase domains
MYLATIDFETKGIEKRPNYPPEPVGVSIKTRGKNKYWSWSHPTGNNCTKAQARAELKTHFKNARCVFHHAAFDIDVAMVHLGLPVPVHIEDTLFLAYLIDPRTHSLGLKPLATKFLNMPPDEQDELKNWILEHVPAAKRKPSSWGAYIAEAPGKLVAKYAKGDTLRTDKLFNLWYPQVREMNMLPAYHREINLIHVKLSMETGGVHTAHRRLKKDLPRYQNAQLACIASLRRKLKINKAIEVECPKGFFNINSNDQLADALEWAGMVDEWVLTDKGNRSTSVENLQAVVTDKHFLKMYAIYSTLETYINTFLGPWYETGLKTGGVIHPTFNQVRTEPKYGGKGVGTKTGRPSVTNPNFNNIPANVEDAKNAAILKTVAAHLKKFGVNFIGLRDYITPAPGQYLIGRDYAQQELRILAHYEDGALMRAYREDPNLDIHAAIQRLLHDRLSLWLTRKAIKKIAFAIIYGYGLEALADELETTYDEAKRIKQAYMSTLPGVRDLQRELKMQAQADEPIRTFGGRLYYCEPPKFVNGSFRSFEYKLLNLLIQGTAADITKEAMVRIHKHPDFQGRIILQLYDEIVVDTPAPDHDMKIMKYEMENAMTLDVALPTDGEISKVSWAKMKPYKDK